jgi:hypothetical protein
MELCSKKYKPLGNKRKKSAEVVSLTDGKQEETGKPTTKRYNLGIGERNSRAQACR